MELTALKGLDYCSDAQNALQMLRLMYARRIVTCLPPGLVSPHLLTSSCISSVLSFHHSTYVCSLI